GADRGFAVDEVVALALRELLAQAARAAAEEVELHRGDGGERGPEDALVDAEGLVDEAVGELGADALAEIPAEAVDEEELHLARAVLARDARGHVGGVEHHGRALAGE